MAANNNNNNENRAISKSAIAKAQRGIAKVNADATKTLKQDRKMLAATIAYLCDTEEPAAVAYRDWLGLKRGANKQARKEAAARVIANAPYYATPVYITRHDDGTETRTIGVGVRIPVRANGKPYSDYMDALRDAKTYYDKVTAARNLYAQELRVMRAKRQANGTYDRAAIERIQARGRNNAPRRAQVVMAPIDIAK